MGRLRRPALLAGARPATSHAGAELRPLTPAEDEAASELGMYCPRWYGVWIDSGFTPEEIAEWYPLTTYRTVLPEAAARLIAAGWGPDDLRDAITRPWTEYRPPANAEQALREAVLWDEVAAYHHSQVTRAVCVRDSALRAAREHGMPLEALTRPFGWTRNQVERLTTS